MGSKNNKNQQLKKTASKNEDGDFKTKSESSKTMGNSSTNAKSQSHSSVWFILFLLTIGIGFGAFHILEEMKYTNATMANQIIDLKLEIQALNNFKEKAEDLENQLNSLNSFKNEFQSVQDDNLSMLKSTEIKTNENKINLEEMAKIIHELKQHQKNNQEEFKLSKTNTMTSFEKLESFIQDSLKVIETNIEGFSGDITRFNLQTKTQQTEVSNLKNGLKLIENSVSKNEDSLNQNKKTTDDQYIFLQETVIGQLQQSTDNKISTFEKTTSDTVSVLSQQVNTATNSVEALKSTQEENLLFVKEQLAEVNLLREAAVDTLNKENQALQVRQEKLENDLSSLGAGGFATEAYVLDNVDQRTTAVSDSVKLNSDSILDLKEKIEQTSNRVETQISTLTSHVKSSKNDVAMVKEDMEFALAAVKEIKGKEVVEDSKAKTPV